MSRMSPKKSLSISLNSEIHYTRTEHSCTPGQTPPGALWAGPTHTHARYGEQEHQSRQRTLERFVFGTCESRNTNPVKERSNVSFSVRAQFTLHKLARRLTKTRPTPTEIGRELIGRELAFSRWYGRCHKLRPHSKFKNALRLIAQ
ncbi:hypothetical protein QE152_g39534 [Popillia japonica]|uniref:Uncharacterized protein n=1 Tax=Popillia japonica TaxID=7064 RepID=A0AAW1HUI3_POPJA